MLLHCSLPVLSCGGYICFIFLRLVILLVTLVLLRVDVRHQSLDPGFFGGNGQYLVGPKSSLVQHFSTKKGSSQSWGSPGLSSLCIVKPENLGISRAREISIAQVTALHSSAASSLGLSSRAFDTPYG